MSHSNNENNSSKLSLRGASAPKQSRVIANSIFALSVFCFAFLVAFISGTTFLSVGDSSAESKGIGLTANIDSTLAITTNAINDELLLDITPTPSGAQTVADVTVTVSTNNFTGYNLTLNSLSDSTAPLVPLVNEANPGYTIPSTTNAWGSAAALANNTWGVSVWTTGQSTSSTTFSQVPRLTAPQEIRRTSEANTSSATTLTFGAKVDNTKPSGTYTNTVVFTATANAAPIRPYITSVSPTTNWTGGDIYLTGINFPTTTVGTTIRVGGTNCLSIRLISETSAICILPVKATGTVNPIVIAANSGAQTSNTNHTVTYDGVNKGHMQLFDTSTCAAMPVGLAQIYTDARNNNIYRVKKMLDNKCWMIDNLAYGGDGNNFYGDTHSLTKTTGCGSDSWDSDVTPYSTNCEAVSPWGPSLTTLTDNHYFTTNNNNATHLPSPPAPTPTPDTPLPDRMGNIIPNAIGSFDITTPTPCTNSLTGSGGMRSECLSYLYHWCTAVGLDNTTTPTCAAVSEASYGSGLVESASGGPRLGIVGKPSGIGGESKGNNNAANQAGVATTNGTICPAGWRLPVGRTGDGSTTGTNDYNEFAILNGAMYTVGSDLTPDLTQTSNPHYSNWHPAGSFSGISSGRYNDFLGLSGMSNAGFYWSSSIASATQNTSLYFYSVSVSSGTYSTPRNMGFAVRCVLN